jgi:protein-tyrosine-phosphatase
VIRFLWPFLDRMSFAPLQVLFLSTGNAARSLIAEALLNARHSDRFQARSAGAAPLDVPNPEAMALLRAAGLDTARLLPKGWETYLSAASFLKIDVIVTLSEEARARCPIWPGSPVRVHWTVDDPLGAARPEVREWKFRKCFATLDTRIGALLRGRAPQSASELYLQLMDLGMVV